MNSPQTKTEPSSLLIDSANSVIRSSSRQQIVLLGVEDLIVLVTPEKILILPRHRRSQ
jgi:mannose-1-phosphate guanylyltransferase